MDDAYFLDTAIRNLPGGLLLVDLSGRLQAVNRTGQDILALQGPYARGTDCRNVLVNHPKLAEVLLTTCQSKQAITRQEMTTVGTKGDKIVIGYSTLIIKDEKDQAIGVGMSFQDITRFIPLMDAHNFLDVALKNLPGGLVFIDLHGKVRGVNQMAERLLSLTEGVEPGTECHQVFSHHPQVVKALLSACKTLQAANRQELVTSGPDGGRMTLGYGIIVIRNGQNVPIGIGMTFQDITRFIPLPLQAEFIRLVDRFFTPFAFLMVLAAMGLGYATPVVKYWSLGVLTVLVTFNELSVWFARKRPNLSLQIGYTRLVTNYIGNIVLVYLLGTFWGPMWLLFVLTPVATALHADWKKTLVTSAICAGTLLGIYASRDLSGPVGWGMASLHAIFIVFISLFVNSIARLITQIRTHNPLIKPAQKTPSTAETAAQTSNKLAA